MTKKPIVPDTQLRPTAVAVTVRKKRTQADSVDLVVRVTKTDWTRLQQLAIKEGTSMQALARAGLTRVLADHGLPPMAS